jgi:hypothetical protein
LTISVEDRSAAITRALVRLAELCGDARNLWFGEADLVAAAPLGTTIAELVDAGFVELKVMLSNPAPYVLTTEGWFQSQRVSGRLDSPDFHRRRGRLCGAMKRAVEGRQEMALLGCCALAQAAELLEGWVWNVFEAQVLYRLDAQGRYSMRFDEDGTVWVPVTFGQEPARID